MNEYGGIGQFPRWTVLIDKKDLGEIDDESFSIIAKQEALFNNDYLIVEIESKYYDIDCTAQDIMDLIGAWAVHEEYTNAVITTPSGIDELSENMYTWNGSGKNLISDMLTYNERIECLINWLSEERKEKVSIDDIQIKVDKETPFVSLKDNQENIFVSDLDAVKCKSDETKTIWWPNIIKDKGFSIIIIDEDLDDDDDEQKLLPCHSSADDDKIKDYYRDVWGRWGYDDDDYDYGDYYFRRT